MVKLRDVRNQVRWETCELQREAQGRISHEKPLGRYKYGKNKEMIMENGGPGIQ